VFWIEETATGFEVLSFAMEEPTDFDEEVYKNLFRF
jgi:hypothetical protein